MYNVYYDLMTKGGSGSKYGRDLILFVSTVS